MLRELTRVYCKLTLAFTVALCLTTGASAQSLVCQAQPVDTPALRDNGVTERVSDIKIICTGGTPMAAGTQVPHFNLQIFTSPAVNITSRILGGDVSEALLLIDEPDASAQSICGSVATPADPTAPGTCSVLGTGNGLGTYSGAPANGSTPGRPNAFIGRRSGESSVIFNSIPFDPPGNGPYRVMRLTNIRINASQLNNVRGGATALNLVISTTSSGIANSIQIPIGNPAPVVGIAQTPMDLTVSGASFLQCESQNYSGGALSSPLTPQLSLKFTERFASAFRRRSAAIPVSPDAVPAPGESNNLNNAALFETESGFYKTPNGSGWNLTQLGLATPAILDNAGLADSGTRLLARFKNIPGGVILWGANHGQLIQVNNSSLVTGDVHSTLASAAGDGSFSSAGPTGALAEIFPLSGMASFAWEVINTNTTVTEAVTIPVAASYFSAGSQPRVAAATADGQLAPLSSSSTASATAAIPRFVEDQGNNSRRLFSISALLCGAAVSPVLFTLTSSFPGGGTISSSSTGICATTCTALLDPLHPPTYTATPAPGFAFGGWIGACSGTAPCTPFLEESNGLAATFFLLPGGTFSLGVKSGPPNARLWPLVFTGGTFNFGVQNFILTQTAGAACSPVVTPGPRFGTTAQFTVDFTGCPPSARFRLTVPYTVNNNNFTLILNNQFQ